MPLPPVSDLLVLLPGTDARLLGTSVRTRNTRVAMRCGAEIASIDDLEQHGDRFAVLVPASVAIDRALFPLRTEGKATWVQSTPPANAAVLAGPARELRALARDLHSANGLPRTAAPEGALLDVSTAEARRAAGRWLLRKTSKPTDGWIARTLNRPVSQAISYWALQAGLSANAATWLALAVGLLSAFIGAQPGWAMFAASGLLFHLASVLDGVDGEIARTTLTESEKGAHFDAAVDRFTALICFAGVTIGWVREGAGAYALLWTSLVALALGLSLWRAFRFVRRHAPGAPLLVIDGATRRAATQSGAFMLWLASRGFALLRRDLFAVIFMLVGLTGIRALVPALVAFGIAIANIAFSLYGDRIAAALSTTKAQGLSGPSGPSGP